MFADKLNKIAFWLGNRTQVTTYTSEGTSSTLASGGAQTTLMTYDPTYHTYTVSVHPPQLPATSYTYDYALGVVTGETEPNGSGTNITAVYDNFGRLTMVIKPGDSSASPTVRITYTDTRTIPGCSSSSA